MAQTPTPEPSTDTRRAEALLQPYAPHRVPQSSNEALNALRVRLIAPEPTYGPDGAHTVEYADVTRYVADGTDFNAAESAVMVGAAAYGWRLSDRCVSGVGSALTVVVPDGGTP